MSIEITMPRLSDTMETGTVIKWNVAVGDAVSSGSIVADIETDKATMELSVFDDGTIASIVVEEGATVDVGAVIAMLAEEGENVAEVAVGGGSIGAAAPTALAANPTPAESDRIRVSPVARRLAEDHGLDVGQIQGSGPGGRIIKRDVLSAIEATTETVAAVPPSAAAPTATSRAVSAPTAPAPVAPAPPVSGTAPIANQIIPVSGGRELARREPLSAMRQTIARRLVESTTTIPHYQVSYTFNMDPLMELRRSLNADLVDQGVKLSVNDFLVRCCALAMKQHPDFNASWDGDAILYHGEVNIGIAISMPAERGGGLVVAVIRAADQKSLRVVSAETRALAERARTKGLSVEDMTGSTFTLSNLGMFGVDNFTAIINPPNSAILAAGSAVLKPVVRDGELIAGHEMTVTLSSDHRIIDGAMAARYLKTLKHFIERPSTLLV